MPVKLIIDGAKVAAMLRGPSGPVYQHLERRAVLFQIAAKRQVDKKVGRSNSISRSIVKRFIEETPSGLSLRVTAQSPISLFFHEGTGLYGPKHAKYRIAARNASVLAFEWPAVGPGTFFFGAVMHPGIKPTHFFTDNLHIFTDAL